MLQTLAIAAGVVVILLVGIYLIVKKLTAKDDEDKGAITLLQNQLHEVSRTLDTKLGESTKAIQSQFNESTKIIRDVTEKLTKLDETNRQVVNFADQLQNLQDILKNPKQRGILGEYYLETVLKNVLPPNSFQMQYAFKDGTIVDAVVFIKDKIVPIDSKFSLENYNKILQCKDDAERKQLESALRQDLKARIDETSKYIKPDENTMEFAFMFIPAEAVYYDLLVNKVGTIHTRDLIDYAIIDKKVIIVSPTSFLAYLQTVLQGLRALQIEESAKGIRKEVEKLGRHLGSYETYMQKLGNHLGTAVRTYNTAYKEFGKIDKDVMKITGESPGTEPMVLDGIETEHDDEK